MARLGLDINISGFEELDQTMQKMVQAMKPDIVEPILLKGATVMADKVRSLAPHGPTGNLISSVKAKTLTRYGNSPAPSIAAVDYRRAPHAHLVEYGTGPRRPKKKKVMANKKTRQVFGKYAGPMPARPFFRPGVDMSRDQAGDTIIHDLGQEIDRAVK